MAAQDGENNDLQALAEQGLKLNRWNRAYVRGRIIGVERTAEIVHRYVKMMDEGDGKLVPVLALAKSTRVSWKVAKRIIDGYHGGHGYAGSGQYQNRPLGPGSKLNLTYEHETYLLYLRLEDPFPSNNDNIAVFFNMQASSCLLTS